MRSIRLADSVSDAVLNVRKVLSRSKFDQSLANKIEDVIRHSENIIQENLDYLGVLIVEDIKDKMRSEADFSGHTYAYIDDAGDILEEFTSSSAGGYPAFFSETLINNIEHMAGYGTLHFGVWSDDTGDRRGTKYYIGLTDDDKRKRIESRFGKEPGVYANYHGLLVEGDHKTPVSEYAKMLQHGTGRMGERPFIREEDIKEYARNYKKHFYSILKTKLATRMRRKKVPVYFFIKLEE